MSPTVWIYDFHNPKTDRSAPIHLLNSRSLSTEDTRMPRYLIEVPHSADRLECARVIKVFLETGSHFLTHADWGCVDGEHKAWSTVEGYNRNDARSIVPRAYREQARIIQLGNFTMEEIDRVIDEYHQPGT